MAGSISATTALQLGFAGSSAIGSAASGFGQYEAGQQQRQAYDYNADVTLEQMQQKQRTTEASYANLIGKQASSFAAAGVDIASGSPLLVMLHTAAQAGTESASEAEAGTEEAALQRYYGRVAAFNGTIGGISSFISGLGKAGMGAASILGPSSSYGTVPTVPNSFYTP